MKDLFELIRFSISYTGKYADKNQIDFYDISQSLIGLQRSLALTTHLVINDEIIIQAPSLRGAQLLALPSEAGSWKTTVIIASTAYTMLTAPNNTPLGHLIFSAYDYVVSETLGFHVDYNKSLGQQYEELEKKDLDIPVLSQHRFDALAEKCLKPIQDMHRPIYANKTAEFGNITGIFNNHKYPVGTSLSLTTYEYISISEKSNVEEVVCGRVSSYNSNTYKGRIYIENEGRPISFSLSPGCRSTYYTPIIANSLFNAIVKNESQNSGYIYCKVFKFKSKTGMLKSLEIIDVSEDNEFF